MKVTYFLEVTSSWCYWAEPMWAELKLRYAGRATFAWKIAQMKAADYSKSREQCDWFYRRSGMAMRSPFMLTSAWWEAVNEDTLVAPNLVAEAARDFGFDGDEIRLALAHACMREGRPILQMPIAIEVAVKAAAGNLEMGKLRARAESAEVRARVLASTQEFFSHQLNQRPAFILEDTIGDKAVFSGLVKIEPLAATIDAMLADVAAYAAHAAHFGPPPPA